MSELFTTDELERYLREEVMRAGGAKKWCKKNGVYMGDALHMVSNGSAATLDRVCLALGFRKITRYEPIHESGLKTALGDNGK